MKKHSRLNAIFSIIIISTLAGSFAAAQASAVSARTTFCQQASNKAYFQNRLMLTSTRVAFNNNRSISAFNLIGIDSFKIGICWWHSRFQRSLAYLAVPRPLNPNEQPMSLREVNSALNQIINESSVVELRGYNSILEFTEQHKARIIERLNYWQLIEAPQFARGLVGNSKVAPENLEQKMHNLYQLVETEKTVPFQVQQISGLEAHSWLVVGMAKTYKNQRWMGYSIMAIDSVASDQTAIFEYHFGDQQLGFKDNAFVPYTQHSHSELRYFTALAYYCKPEKTKAHLEDKFYVTATTEGLFNKAIKTLTFDKSFLAPKKWASFLK